MKGISSDLHDQMTSHNLHSLSDTNPFILIIYADLKAQTYLHWICFPSFVPSLSLGEGHSITPFSNYLEGCCEFEEEQERTLEEDLIQYSSSNRPFVLNIKPSSPTSLYQVYPFFGEGGNESTVWSERDVEDKLIFFFPQSNCSIHQPSSSKSESDSSQQQITMNWNIRNLFYYLQTLDGNDDTPFHLCVYPPSWFINSRKVEEESKMSDSTINQLSSSLQSSSLDDNNPPSILDQFKIISNLYVSCSNPDKVVGWDVNKKGKPGFCDDI